MKISKLSSAPALLASMIMMLSPATFAQTQAPSDRPSAAVIAFFHNGSGVRTLDNAQIYRVSLYLSQPAHSLDQVLQSNGAKSIELQLLKPVTSDELGRLLTKAIESSTGKQELSRLIPGLIQMSEIFSKHKRFAQGDVLTVNWVPQHGTVISIKGQVQSTPLKDPAFFNALLGIWIGDRAVDESLKLALLGKSAT